MNRAFYFALQHGVQVLAWGEAGSVVGQFSLPTNLAVDRRYVYVADAANRRIQIFDKGGAFVRSWTDPANQGYDIWGVAVDDASIYIAGRQRGSGLYPYNMRLWITDKTGAVRGTCSWLGATTQDSVAPFGIAVGSPYLYVATLEDDRVHTVRRIYRTLGAVTNNAIPLAEVYAVKQREGTHTIDIDYVVSDPDDATVTVYAIAFAGVTNDTPGLAEVMPVRTLLEGTASNVGPGIATGPVHRLTWDSGTDGLAEKIADYGALRVALLVRDGRAPLDLHMLELPAVGTGAALTINRAPLFDEDLLPLWFWLLAAGDADIALNAGELRGVSGDYAGQPLAQGVNTTALGRQFMFERLGYREATPEELTYAREATTPGSVTYREPRREPPRAGYKVNEFNFVTDPTNGWWVVPLAP